MVGDLFLLIYHMCFVPKMLFCRLIQSIDINILTITYLLLFFIKVITIIPVQEMLTLKGHCPEKLIR